MSNERPDEPAYLPANEVFGLTRQEGLSYRVSDERLRAILDDERTTVHKIEQGENNYGDFVFVIASRPAPQGRALLTFYGLGFHEQREKWFTGEWFWYRTNPFKEVLEQSLSREEAQRVLEKRLASIMPYVTDHPPSRRAQLFAMLADLTDEDGAYTELEDMGADLAGWLDEGL